MYSTLNSKFTSEVQTKHHFDKCNQHFLAQKIFDKTDYNGDFSNMMVSWAQFNKVCTGAMLPHTKLHSRTWALFSNWKWLLQEVRPGRTFTFWQWFEGVMELTKKHLRTYWSEKWGVFPSQFLKKKKTQYTGYIWLFSMFGFSRLIFGFIGKQHLHLILKDKPNGTFLLRFSDSEIGGITIAYVSTTDSKQYGFQRRWDTDGCSFCDALLPQVVDWKSKASSPSPRGTLRSAASAIASLTLVTSPTCIPIVRNMKFSKNSTQVAASCTESHFSSAVEMVKVPLSAVFRTRAPDVARWGLYPRVSANQSRHVRSK